MGDHKVTPDEEWCVPHEWAYQNSTYGTLSFHTGEDFSVIKWFIQEFYIVNTTWGFSANTAGCTGKRSKRTFAIANNRVSTCNPPSLQQRLTSCYCLLFLDLKEIGFPLPLDSSRGATLLQTSVFNSNVCGVFFPDDHHGAPTEARWFSSPYPFNEEAYCHCGGSIMKINPVWWHVWWIEDEWMRVHRVFFERARIMVSCYLWAKKR